MSLTTIIGPMIMNNLFTYFTSKNAPFHFPGVSFELGALFMLMSLLIAWNLLGKKEEPGQKKRLSRTLSLIIIMPKDDIGHCYRVPQSGTLHSSDFCHP